jgi:hypothetical protein
VVREYRVVRRISDGDFLANIAPGAQWFSKDPSDSVFFKAEEDADKYLRAVPPPEPCYIAPVRIRVGGLF